MGTAIAIRLFKEFERGVQYDDPFRAALLLQPLLLLIVPRLVLMLLFLFIHLLLLQLLFLLLFILLHRLLLLFLLILLILPLLPRTY